MLSGSEQEQIQLGIDQMTAEERATLMANARRALQNARDAMDVSVLTREQRHAIERMVEIVVRIEGLELGKGWWFRTKRRAQIGADIYRNAA